MSTYDNEMDATAGFARKRQGRLSEGVRNDQKFDFAEWETICKIIPQFNESTTIVRCGPRISKFAIAAPEKKFSIIKAAGEWKEKDGTKAWLWRIVGAIFNRHDWWRNGAMYYLMPPTPITEEQVEIKKAIISDIFGDYYVAFFGYSAATDTLIISGEFEPLPDPWAIFGQQPGRSAKNAERHSERMDQGSAIHKCQN